MKRLFTVVVALCCLVVLSAPAAAQSGTFANASSAFGPMMLFGSGLLDECFDIDETREGDLSGTVTVTGSYCEGVLEAEVIFVDFSDIEDVVLDGSYFLDKLYTQGETGSIDYVEMWQSGGPLTYTVDGEPYLVDIQDVYARWTFNPFTSRSVDIIEAEGGYLVNGAYVPLPVAKMPILPRAFF
jgi:hypothetical protein